MGEIIKFPEYSRSADVFLSFMVMNSFFLKVHLRSIGMAMAVRGQLPFEQTLNESLEHAADVKDELKEIMATDLFKNGDEYVQAAAEMLMESLDSYKLTIDGYVEQLNRGRDSE